MQIGFDAKRAAQNGTGLGNYSRFVIALLERYGKDVLHLYIPNPARSKLLRRLPLSPRIIAEYPRTMLARGFRSLWRLAGITFRLGPDGIELYHGLSGELPLGIGWIGKRKGIRSIVTIHDLLFLRFPQGYKRVDRWIYDWKFRYACRHADHIIAVSQFTKKEIINRYHIGEEKVSVVYQGCDAAFREVVSDEKKREVRKVYDIPEDRPFILYVGSIERRKNLMLPAKALKGIERSIKIIAVGKYTPYVDEIKEFLKKNKLGGRMHFFHDVPFDHLPALYQMASVFVYPSRCEGFGIPILESLWSGTPVVACTGSCLEEAGGEGGIYVNPDDHHALALEINRILQDGKHRQELIEKGKKHALNFQDEPLYRSLSEVYQKVCTK